MSSLNFGAGSDLQLSGLSGASTGYAFAFWGRWTTSPTNAGGTIFFDTRGATNYSQLVSYGGTPVRFESSGGTTDNVFDPGTSWFFVALYQTSATSALVTWWTASGGWGSTTLTYGPNQTITSRTLGSDFGSVRTGGMDIRDFKYWDSGPSTLAELQAEAAQSKPLKWTGLKSWHPFTSASASDFTINLAGNAANFSALNTAPTVSQTDPGVPFELASGVVLRPDVGDTAALAFKSYTILSSGVVLNPVTGTGALAITKPFYRRPALGTAAVGAMVVTEPTAEIASTSNASSYAMGAFTPTANTLLVCLVWASATVATGTMSGGGLTWTRQASVAFNASADTGYIFTAPVGASPASTTPTFDCTGDAATGCMMVIFQVTNYNVANPLAQTKAIAGTTANPSTGTLAQAQNTNNTYLAGFGVNRTAPSSTPPNANWTEVADTGYNNPTAGATAAYRVGGETGTSVAFTSAIGNWAVLYVEVNKGLTGNTGYADLDLKSFTESASGTAGSSNPTGTAALAAKSFTESASSTVLNPVTGTASLANDRFTVASSGTEKFTGTSSLATKQFTIAVAASEKFTGTATLTLKPFTESASGALKFSGTGTPALKPFTLSASGAERFTGTSALTADPFALSAGGSIAGAVSGTASLASDPFAVSAAGSEKFTGTGALAAKSFALTASAIERFTGTAALASDAFTLAASALERFSGTSSLANDPFALSATGSEKFTGTSALANDRFGLSSSGSIAGVLSGSAALAFKQFTESASGSEKFSGTSALANDRFGLAASGSAAGVSISGTAALANDRFAASSSATERFSGSATLASKRFTEAGSGAETFAGSCAPALRAFTASAACVERFTGTALLTLAFQLAASGTALLAITGSSLVTLRSFALITLGQAGALFVQADPYYTIHVPADRLMLVVDADTLTITVAADPLKVPV